MNLTLVGLILSFLGSAKLVYDTLANLGKLGPVYIRPTKISGWKAEKFDRQTDGYLKRVKYLTKEQINLVISLLLLCSGFLLQIFDFWLK